MKKFESETNLPVAGFLIMVTAFTAISVLSGCEIPVTPNPSPTTSATPPISTPSPSSTTSASTTPTTTPSSVSGEKPLIGWPESYTAFVRQSVPASLLSLPKIDFCPNWKLMKEPERRQTWAMILKGISKPESNWKRTERFKEPGMTDPQGRQVWSEGLLQLSMQDAGNYSAAICQKLSRAANGSLADTDPNRPIFDPYINLGCGLAIMEKLMVKYNASVGAVGALGKYWSTIRRGKCAARGFINQ